MSENKGNPRVTLRVTQGLYEAMQKHAKLRRQRVSDWVREVVSDAVVGLPLPPQTTELRLGEVERACGEFAKAAQEQAAVLEEVRALVASAIASSALMQDDGMQPVEVARDRVAEHTRLSFLAADFVLQTHLASHARA